MESPTGCGKKKNHGSSKAANSLELVQCKVCRAFLLCKDTDVHTAKDGICDKLISTKNPTEVLHSSFKKTHGFILNGTLFCSVRKLPSKDEEQLKHLPKCIKKQLVLLHPTIMEFCKIRPGDRVAIFTPKNKWYLYHVLESKNILPASMCFYDELALLPTPDLLMVVSYSKPLPKAAAITVQFKTLEKEMHDAHFEEFLVSQNCGVGVSPGSELSFSYLGTHPKVIIKSIVDEEGHKHEQTESAVWTKRDDDDDHTAHHLNEITSNFSAISLNNNSECQEGNSCFDDEESTREHSQLVSSTPVRKLVEHLSISTEVNNSDCSINIPTFVAISQCTKIEIKMEPIGFPESKEELLLNKIGGLEKQINLLRKFIERRLKFPEKCTSLGREPRHCVLIYGPPGTGKTMVVKAVAQEARMNFVYINGHEMIRKYHGQIGARLNKIFEDAIKRSPSILFIDEIDVLCSKKERVQSEQGKLALSTLLSLIDDLSNNISNRLLVIAATNSPDSLDPSLRRAGRFHKTIEFGVPTAADRKEILLKMLAGMKHDLSTNDIEEIAAAAHGFTGADLGSVCDEAVELTNDHCNQQSSGEETSSIKVTKEYMWYALKHVRPSAMQEITLEVPKVYWKDIGGMHEVKKRLKQAVEWPLKYPEALKAVGATPPPRGVLLYGPPGCSKTMIAKALATESGLNFIAIKGPELFSKWVGESEEAVREVFRKAQAAAPSILFFDEIEAISFARGSGNGSNVGDRVLAQLLTMMDGIEPLKDVMVIAATNRPDMIDKALLRPGRLDRSIYVPLPDFETRKEIFKIRLQSLTVKGIDINELAAKTENYSGAEIVLVCKEAGLKALEEDISSTIITRKHFDAVLKVIQPGTSQKMLKFYNEFSIKNVQ